MTKLLIELFTFDGAYQLNRCKWVEMNTADIQAHSADALCCELVVLLFLTRRHPIVQSKYIWVNKSVLS